MVQQLHDEDVIRHVDDVINDELELEDAAEHIAVLEFLDNSYHNEADSVVPDQVYDAFRLIIQTAFPTHPYFATIGAAVRGGKINLPHQLGSLTQVEVGGLSKWIAEMGLTPEDELIITAKLDGSSGLAGFGRTGFKIGYSRGNGIQGADITRHMQHFVPEVKENMWVRGENIIARNEFEYGVQPVFKRSNGDPYKNPRNAVSGMMNASAHKDASIYESIDFMAYDILGQETLSKSEQLQKLQDLGFKTPMFWVVKTKNLTEDLLAEMIAELRDDYDYEIDGVVVDVNDAARRQTLNKGNTDLNPVYAMKYKTLDTSNYAETEVISVEWRVSFRGYWKPRVNYKPCSLPGITSTYATGYNAKFILDNGIGPGAIVGVSRMGEVVPNIIRTVQSTTAQMPNGDWHWTETGVDAVADDPDSLPEVFIKQVVHSVDKLHMNFPHLGEGAVRKLVEHTGAGSYNETMTLILSLDEDDWVEIIGANGKKIYDGVAKRFHDMDAHTFVGSLPFFGRGVGIRKMKKVFAQCQNIVGFKLLDASEIAEFDSFDLITANKIVAGMDPFFKFYDALPIKPKFKVNAVTGDAVAGLSICGTGFRDKAFDGWVEANGGKVASGVSANTNILVAADPKSNSGKVKKARDLNASGKGNVTIMSLQEFNEKYGR